MQPIIDWNSRLDWWTIYFYAKQILCSLMRPHALVRFAMMHFNLHKVNVKTQFSLTVCRLDVKLDNAMLEHWTSGEVLL